jgi:hypothetical protein
MFDVLEFIDDLLLVSVGVLEVIHQIVEIALHVLVIFKQSCHLLLLVRQLE